jgi:hypothetical protein
MKSSLPELPTSGATKYNKVHIYPEYLVSVPSSELGYPHPLSRRRVRVWGGGGVPIQMTGEKA